MESTARVQGGMDSISFINNNVLWLLEFVCWYGSMSHMWIFLCTQHIPHIRMSADTYCFPDHNNPEFTHNTDEILGNRNKAACYCTGALHLSDSFSSLRHKHIFLPIQGTCTIFSGGKVTICFSDTDPLGTRLLNSLLTSQKPSGNNYRILIIKVAVVHFGSHKSSSPVQLSGERQQTWLRWCYAHPELQQNSSTLDPAG